MNISKVKSLREEINPGDYSYVGFYYVGPNVDIADALCCEDHNAACDAMEQAGKLDQMGCCEHCGTGHYYGVVYDGPDGVIAVGNHCAQNFFQFGNKLDYAINQAKKQAERAKQRREWAALSLAQAEAFLADHPEVEMMLAIDHKIIADMETNLFKFGRLSSKQIDFMAKLVIEVHTPTAAEVVPTEPLAEGRYLIEGEVLSTKLQESQYGSTWKMLVKMADGNKVWGSVPSRTDWDKGDVVKFKATVERSKDDQHFGFFKRPTVVK